MKIAVNTRFLLNDYPEDYGYFISETFKRITKAYPQHEFIFIFDRPFDERLIFSSNIRPVVIGPAARHPVLWWWWYNIKIPAVLRKYKADVFVSPDGFASLYTHTPQCMVLHDLAFLHYPSFIKKSHFRYYKKYTPVFLKKAKIIATVSQFSKQDIIQQYDTDEKKIDVVYSAAKEIFHPVNDDVKSETKNKYTDGKEYFLYAGAIHPRKNLINLLKAFSVFKKRQRSTMKLVLAGRLAWKYDSFIENLKTYRYRDEVILAGYIEEDEMAKLTAAAYALVYPSYFEGFGMPALEAIKCGVPVITTANSSMQEIAGNSALYVNPDSYTDIGEKMMQLYKDEAGRSALIQQAKEAAAIYNWNKTADLLWQSICKCVG